MDDQFDNFMKSLKSFGRYGVDYVLIGGKVQELKSLYRKLCIN